MNGEKPLEQRICDSIIAQHLFKRGDTVVVAVSGGADSICLLSILAKIREALGVSIHVAHLDHGLRGRDSQADAVFVADFAAQLGIPTTVEHRDVLNYKKRHRCSLEEAARNVRYTFLADTMHRIKGSCVAVGHTRNDHIETILLHIIRGSGITGLRGLQSRSSLIFDEIKHPLTIIRPLLSISREETVAYCHQHKLRPQHDTSNDDQSFLRNRIRLELLPQLRNYNAGIEDALTRLSSLAADDLAYIEEQALNIWGSVVQAKDRALYFDKKVLKDLPIVMQRQIFRMGLAKLAGSTRDFDAGHLESMVNFVTKPAGKTLSLPHGLTLSSLYGILILSPSHVSPCPLPLLKEKTAIHVPGEIEVDGWHITTKIVRQTQSTIRILHNTASGFKATFDLNALGRDLIVRNRQPGDRFQPLGMNRTKKLQDFMVDVRIPRAWRSRVPLLCTKEHIAWIVGWQIDDRVKITKNSSAAVQITFRSIDCDN